VLDGKFRSAITDLATASERASRADALAGQVEQARALLLDAQGEVATLRANATHFEEQKRLLLEAQDALRQQFEASGARVLAQAQEGFCRAEARFTESEKTSAERMSAVLAPVGARLKAYEEQVQALETRRVDAFGQLLGQIDLLRAGRKRCARKPPVSATRCAMRPRRAAAGASSSSAMCWSNAACPNTPISSPSIRSTRKKAACAPTPSSPSPARRSW
jgi:hypothetical protein